MSKDDLECGIANLHKLHFATWMLLFLALCTGGLRSCANASRHDKVMETISKIEQKLEVD